MASATVDSDPPIQLDSIPIVDLRFFSQSELYALSLCSNTPSDPQQCDDVVIPKIDRSVFNESAGSRKQTYSRLRLAPAASNPSIRRRTPHLRSPKPSSIQTDPDRAESSQIVGLLKGLFKSETDGDDFTPVRVEHDIPAVPDKSVEVNNNMGSQYQKLMAEFSNSVSGGLKRKRGRPRKDENAVVEAKIEIKDIFYENVDRIEKRDDNIGTSDLSNVDTDIGKKRKRGRPRKGEIVVPVVKVKKVLKETTGYDCENVEEIDKEVVNSKGVIVDLVVLGGLEDPFGPEIRRRAQGMGRVDELLGFLEKLGGRWGTTRKKRRIVDASDFGDYLPKGWKISIALKRKSGQVWLFCRRYISPSGRQFISCKDVSSYLLSICGLQDKNQPSFPHCNENIQFASKMASRNAADLAYPENNGNDDIVSHSSLAVNSLSSNLEEQNALKTGEPMEVQIGETLKCDNTFHKNNRDNDHIGAHVENDVKSAEEPAVEHVREYVDTSPLGEVPNGESLVEATVSADKIETSTDKLDYDPQNVANGKQDFAAIGDGRDTLGASNELDNDKMEGVDEPMDVLPVESRLCSGSEAALTNKGNDGIIEISCGNLENKVIGVSESVEGPKILVTGSGSLDPNGNRKPSDTEKITRVEQHFSFEGPSHLPASENYENRVSSSTIKESREEEQASFVSLISQSGLEQNCVAEKSVDSLPARKVASERNEVGPNANMSCPKDRSLQFCSLFPSGTERIFGSQKNVNGIRHSLVEERPQENSENGLVARSYFAENKVYNMPVDELKFNDGQNLGNHDLSLAFNNSQVELFADTTSFEHEKYPANFERNFGVQTNNVSRVNNNMVEEQGVGGSLSGLFSLSCNGNFWGSETSWAAEVDEVGNSGNKKYMVDFGSNNDQPGETVNPGGIWRTGQAGALHSNLAGTSNPLVQAPGSFGTFNITSNKAESCFEEQRSGRTEPVEFSFLTTENSTSHQGNSKNFAYDTGMEQGFDSSFWLGKHDLMPNMPTRSQVTTLCVWCQNEFHHDPVHFGSQASIGSLCPTCRARISEQVNVL